MNLVTVSEMRAIEKEADAAGLTYAKMVENAGSNLAKEIYKLVDTNQEEEIHIIGLVGPGNNGGDTLVALGHLAKKGWKVRAYLVNRNVESDPLIKNFMESGGEVLLDEKDSNFMNLRSFIESTDILLDGLLGTGFKLPLKEAVGKVMVAVKSAMAELDCPPLIIAVDCPSGVDCDSGASAEVSIPADITITMAAVKQGLLKMPAYDLVGDLRLVGIGSLDRLSSWHAIKNFVADEQFVRSILPPRPTDAHKGTFGTALIVSGSVNYTGAVLLAGKAAYRAGVGLVTMAVPTPLHAPLAGQLPEATWILLPHEMGVITRDAVEVLIKRFERATSLLIGPGLGMEETTQEFVETLLKGASTSKPISGQIGFVQRKNEEQNRKQRTMPPLVIDADGLKLLAKIPEWSKILTAPTVLTPHPGEMSVLTGLTIDEIQKDRRAVAARFAQTWNQVVVLKGAFTVIASPDSCTMTIPVATPALARAGTGDVLAGLIVGLRAQGMDAYEAAVAGAWIHAQAGVYAADMLGSSTSVLASDVLDAIPDVIADLE